MAGRTAHVPTEPVIRVVIDDDGLVTVDDREIAYVAGHDPRGAAAEVVARDFAQPLGRPVRVIAWEAGAGTSLVVHPDARVTDVEPVGDDRKGSTPHSPAGVEPAVRARAWLDARRATETDGSGRRSVIGALRAAVRGPEPRPRERSAAWRRPLGIVLGAAALAGGLGLAVWLPSGSDQPQDLTRSLTDDEQRREQPTGPAPVVTAPTLRANAIADVVVDTDPERVSVSLTARRATTVLVTLSPLGRGEPAVRRIKVRRAAEPQVTFRLDPGRYRWVVRAPGQPIQRGRVTVAPKPAPPPVVAPEVDSYDDEDAYDETELDYDPPSVPDGSGSTEGGSTGGGSNDGGSGNGGSGGDNDGGHHGGNGGQSSSSAHGGSPGTGPSGPVDPN